MKSVIIFYFSGTGNTEIVADMLHKEFSDNSYYVRLIKIEDALIDNLKLAIKEYDMVGIGSPVIGYGAPTIVKNFIHNLPTVNAKKVFIFRTAGGVAPINYNASKSMIKQLKRKGYDVFHERIFSISSNWVVKFDDSIVKQLHTATKNKVTIMCKELIAGKTRILTTGLKFKIIIGLAKRIFPPLLRLVGKDMTIDQSCTNCGLCIKKCPSQNIYKKDGKIRFKLSCNSCMRCVYSCPNSSINFRLLKFFPVKGGYDIKKTLEQCNNSISSDKQHQPAFFEGYIQNDDL